MKYLITLLLISGCGFNGTQRLEVSGGTKSSFDINLTFIQELIQLCRDSLLPSDYASTQLYNQAVANCVLNSAKALSPSNLSVCRPGADLSGFTPEQLAAVHALCGG